MLNTFARSTIGRYEPVLDPLNLLLGPEPPSTLASAWQQVLGKITAGLPLTQGSDPPVKNLTRLTDVHAVFFGNFLSRGHWCDLSTAFRPCLGAQKRCFDEEKRDPENCGGSRGLWGLAGEEDPIPSRARVRQASNQTTRDEDYHVCGKMSRYIGLLLSSKHRDDRAARKAAERPR